MVGIKPVTCQVNANHKIQVWTASQLALSSPHDQVYYTPRFTNPNFVQKSPVFFENSPVFFYYHSTNVVISLSYDGED